MKWKKREHYLNVGLLHYSLLITTVFGTREIKSPPLYPRIFYATLRGSKYQPFDIVIHHFTYSVRFLSLLPNPTHAGGNQPTIFEDRRGSGL